MPLPSSKALHSLSLLLLLSISAAVANGGGAPASATIDPGRFKEAPEFYNSPACPSLLNASSDGNGDDDSEGCDGEDDVICSETAVHVAMTLDAAYIRGSMAAILSVLQHSTCPQNVIFHFVYSAATADASLLRATVSSSFPYLRFQLHPFDASAVSGLISTSIRSALDCPLNYARSYLANLLPLCVRRVVYLDSDLVLVDDIASLAATPLDPGSAVLAAPEYCNANFTSYFTPTFWSSPSLPLTFAGRRSRPCYFNTGVMVIDLDRWRAGGYTAKIEEWMELQKRMRIYELGSLPPFPAGVRRGDRAGGPPVEPARPRRRQLPGAVPGPAPRPGQPPALERQGEAVGAARRQPAVPLGRLVGSLRSLAHSLLTGLLIQNQETRHPRRRRRRCPKRELEPRSTTTTARCGVCVDNARTLSPEMQVGV
ncbi:hypothetical protein EUGRSUZ_F01531 [Eucalyptus grandis]|uniref:Uncharacterized protein n=2 Tax=Eucalyptus grandis TaxID=71139 RepID=A0ACC3KEF1_EUCGR|nr:hypothetical protein EUGRSUZ_F01531 [Eucalyptus grandis]